MSNKEIREEAKQLRIHPRVWRRILSDESGTLSMKRFHKFNDWLVRKEKSEANAVIFAEGGYIFSGGRGLIHKGRKP